MSKICIVIPCYNEGNRFPVVYFQNFHLQNPTIYFCLVNDGSHDNTLEILKAIAYENTRIKVISLSQNKGKAEAVRQGMLFGLDWEDFDAIGYFDADMATPLVEVELLYKALEQTGKDYVLSFGSRIKRLGASIERNYKRHYIGRIFSTCASLLLKLPIYDTQCGAKLFRGSIVKTLFQQPFISSWLFDIEIFARLIDFYKDRTILHQHLIEVPLREWTEKGDSRIKLSYFFKIPLDLWKIRLKYK